MAENAGTVYAEIRIALDKLQGDITKTQTMFHKVGSGLDDTTKTVTSQFDIMGKNVSKSVKQLSNTTIGQFARMAQGMQKALMAAPIIGAVLMIAGAIKSAFTSIANWVEETSGAYIAHQQKIAKLNTVLQATGAIAWTSSRQLEEQAKTLSDAT